MKKSPFYWRTISLIFLFVLIFFLILSRLFYWQVLANDKLVLMAKNQYHSEKEITAVRGEIISNDDLPLVTNKKAYLLYAILPQLTEEKEKIAEKLAPLLAKNDEEATESAKKKDRLKLIEEEKTILLKNLATPGLNWVGLGNRLSEEIKTKIEEFKIKGLGFEEESIRFYPEASMAAHLLGFLGKNEGGKDTGYFGIEGYYDLELKGRQGMITEEKDALNDPILIGSYAHEEKKDGQSLVLYLDRTVQMLIEEKLAKAVEKYKAKAGSVIVMDSKTGGIIGLANFPSFNQEEYFKFDKNLYNNSVISEAYEPGSTFKIFVMAAGLDKGVIKTETKCDICTEPLKIDKYTIKNWNDKYHPNSNMNEVLQNSDNTGMVFVARKLGVDNLWEYLNNFGFGEKTKIDLQGEAACVLKPKKEWNEVDLATAGFGQGLAVTGIQMLKAISAIANDGSLVEPHVVKEVIFQNSNLEVKPKIIREVIKPETAKLMKKMMVSAVEKGETKWLAIPGYKVAGKTGTAQIPVSGHYDSEKTIASFIGFAPVQEPKFVMLVKLREPSVSPWGSETAAPLFFSIAKDLLIYYGIQPG